MQVNNNVQTNGSRLLTVISYNLHGLNQGLPGLTYLIDKLNPDVIMIQEHWLTSDNLYKLSDISSRYFVFGSSAMDARVSAGPLMGRPFGGTAILIKNEFINATVNIIACERFCVVKVVNWLLINVYLPCSGTDNRMLIYDDIFCELQSIMLGHADCDCLVGGDFNSDLSDCRAHAANTVINDFIVSNKLHRCDVLFPAATKYTYVSESLNCASTIDYMLTSDPLLTVAYNILDIDINLSDHLLCARSMYSVCPLSVARSMMLLISDGTMLRCMFTMNKRVLV